MKQENPYVISEFTNPSGKIVFPLYARIDGKRFRKNFPTRAEAEAERQIRGIEYLQQTEMRVAATRLADAQLREAEALFARVGGQPRSLSFYVEFALTNYREPTCRKPLNEAAAEFVAAKEHEFEQDLISETYLVRLRREMKRLQKRCPVATVAELTPARIVAYCEFGRASRKTYNNRRGTVSCFLKFALHREWITENPLAKIPAFRIRRRRGGAQTLTAAQAKELMEFVATNLPAAVPFFALCLFAGIRPCLRTGEILRLQPAHVRLAEGLIRIDGEVSKVREPRPITIQPNLAAWLRAYPLKKFPIVPANLQHLREKAVEKFNLSHDIMRHTFISMHVAKFRSIGEAAIQAGNSEAIIRKHYLDLKDATEAEEFWGILPKNAADSAAPKLEAPHAPALPVAA
jgi:integrase